MSKPPEQADGGADPTGDPPAVERVFAVPRERLFGGDWPQGFTPLQPADAKALLADLAAHGWFPNRPEAEEQPAWKQIIPYAVVSDAGRILVVERLKAQSEARLHGMRSIGIGGHIEPQDAGPGGALEPGLFHRALTRELTEELELPESRRWSAELVGLVNDDSTAVGSVHAGLVYRVTLAPGGPPISVRETHKMRGTFHPLVVGSGTVWHTPAFFETWSRYLLNAWLPGQEQEPGGDVGGT